MSDAPTVFVIDDDPSIRSALERLVASVGLNCETFATADEYLAQMNPAAPGCLIVDMRLPGLNGFELQEHLNRDGYHPPIIFLTAAIQKSRVAEHGGVISGALVIAKPATVREIIECIEQHLPK